MDITGMMFKNNITRRTGYYSSNVQNRKGRSLG